MTTLSIGQSVTASLPDGGSVAVATNGGFGTIVATPTVGAVERVEFGPLPFRGGVGPYAEGASVVLSNVSCGEMDWSQSPPAVSAGDSSGLSVDVLVYGATFAGCMAAIRARRMGRTVALVSPQSALGIGGMMTGGIMNVDCSSSNELRCAAYPASSLIAEYMRKLWPNYTFAVQGGNGVAPGSFQQCFYLDEGSGGNSQNEPRVAMPYLLAMLQAEGITVYADSHLTAVTKVGAKLTDATFAKIGKVAFQSAVDATYTGDLLAAAGVTMTTGREAQSQYGETGLGAGYNVQATGQPTVNISSYVTPGDSSSGLIYGVQPNPGLAQGAASPHSMALTYRLAVTSVAGKKVPWPLPDNYDPARYEIQRRWMTANGTGDTGVLSAVNLYGPLPVSYNKYDMNNSRTFCSLNIHLPNEVDEYIRATSIYGLEAGHKRRTELEYFFKQHLLGWIYFMCNDPSVPAGARANWNSFGLCADEYGENGNFPPYPYLRVGRRIVSDLVVSSVDITAPTGFVDPIAKGFYLIDSHRVQYIDQAGLIKVEGGVTTGSQCHVATTLPLRAAVPKASECTNIVGAWCISISAYAWCGIRLEPTMAQFAEAAGACAALAAQTGATVQAVPYADVAYAIDWWGFRSYGGATIKSDGSQSASNEGSYAETGTWTDVVDTLYGTTKWRRSVVAASTGAFLPVIKAPGAHDVYLKFNDLPTPTKSNAVTVTVRAMSIDYVQNFSFRYNGAGAAIGGDWAYLGRFSFGKGDNVNNRVTITTTNTDAVDLVACKFIPAA